MYVRETMKSTVQLVNHFVGFGVTWWLRLGESLHHLGPSRRRSQGKPEQPPAFSPSEGCVLYWLMTNTWKESQRLAEGRDHPGSLSPNSCGRYPQHSAAAKDLTWVLVIIPALSPAYLCNPLLNKALWNTICTNRQLISYFHPPG